MLGIGDTSMAQADGSLPATLTAGSAPGESGVSVFGLRFKGGAHFSATLRRHLVCFQVTPEVRLECRMAGQTLRHEPPAGSLAIFPAGIDCAADAEGSVEALLVAIDPGQLALGRRGGIGAGGGAGRAHVGPATRRCSTSRAAWPRRARPAIPTGRSTWNELASGFIDNLVARHTAEPGAPGARPAGQGRARADQGPCPRPSRRAHRGRDPGGDGGAQPLPLLPRLHPRRRHDAASLCRASPAGARDRPAPRRARRPGRGRGPHAASPTRATSPAGSAASTASPSTQLAA